MDDNDAALVARARAGDHRAFAALVERYQPECLRFAQRMLANAADAEEVVQDSFVRAYRALPRYEHRGQLRAWLYRILVNQCRSRASLVRRRTAQLLLYQQQADADVEVVPGFAIGRATPRLVEEVQAILLMLPLEQREAFLLKYVEELSYEQMAAVTGVGVSALKMRVKRGLDRIRSALAERALHEHPERAAG